MNQTFSNRIAGDGVMFESILLICDFVQCCHVFKAIQMGRPTKYTLPAASSDVNRSPQMIGSDNSSSSSSMGLLGCLIAGWYQAPPSTRSLLHQRLLAQHQSLHACGAVNPLNLLLTLPELSLSPDSTVKESSSDSADVTKRRSGRDEAVNLCGKDTAASFAPNAHQISSKSTAGISTSSVSAASAGNLTVNSRSTLHWQSTQLARRWLDSSETSSIATLLDYSSPTHASESDSALNLSVKPHQPYRRDSSAATTSLSSIDSDNYFSGRLLF